MLAEVRVRDLALLEAVDVTLSPGLNVVSGETGEGKSLLLLAITLLLGARARKGLVRSGAREAVIEGRFRLDAETSRRLAVVTDLVDPAAEELCLRRVVLDDGQSRAYLDGALCPVGLLQRLAPELVDVQGQGETHSLQRSGEQAAALDRFGGLEDRAARYAALHRELRDVTVAMTDLAAREAERAERLEFLRFQAKELQEVSPKPGEETALEAELRLLSRSEELTSLLGDVARILVDDDGALGERAARLARSLAEVAAGHPGLAEVVERLKALGLEAEDLGRTCASLAEDLPSDGRRLTEIDARLGLVRGLARRHRCDADRLAERAAGLVAEIAALEGSEGERASLQARHSGLLAQLADEGQALVAARRKAAKKLEKSILEGLAELRMERARFRIGVEPDSCAKPWSPLDHGESGPGPVRFHVAANPGEPEQPMEKVASGGELARILLALKGALAGAHRIPLLVFDEIDAGIGGRVGVPFGRRIAAIARHHQVLVVTHLPQVAAFADLHLRVRKVVSRGRTRTEIVPLEGPERVDEIAEMLGADAAAEAARAQARALLEEAAS